MNEGEITSHFLKQRYVISDALKQVGLTILAEDAGSQEDEAILRAYLLKAERVAHQNQNTDVLEQLWSAGLIYGY